MKGIQAKNGSVLIRALAVLPLLLMAAAVWYYLSGQYKRGDAGQGREAVPALEPELSPVSTSPAVLYPPGTSVAPPVLDMRGSEEFKAQVTGALKLIWETDRDDFLFIKNNLSVIRSEDTTGFRFEEGRPVASISNDHAFRSMTWCAGIIVHQAWHSWYETQNKKKARPAPPLPGQKQQRVYDFNPMLFERKDLDALLDMENRASLFQLQVLKKIGAPRAETNLVLRRAPRDFSTAHDGTYSLKP